MVLAEAIIVAVVIIFIGIVFEKRGTTTGGHQVQHDVRDDPDEFRADFSLPSLNPINGAKKAAAFTAGGAYKGRKAVWDKTEGTRKKAKETVSKARDLEIKDFQKFGSSLLQSINDLTGAEKKLKRVRNELNKANEEAKEGEKELWENAKDLKKHTSKLDEARAQWEEFKKKHTTPGKQPAASPYAGDTYQPLKPSDLSKQETQILRTVWKHVKSAKGGPDSNSSTYPYAGDTYQPLKPSDLSKQETQILRSILKRYNDRRSGTESESSKTPFMGDAYEPLKSGKLSKIDYNILRLLWEEIQNRRTGSHSMASENLSKEEKKTLSEIWSKIEAAKKGALSTDKDLNSTESKFSKLRNLIGRAESDEGDLIDTEHTIDMEQEKLEEMEDTINKYLDKDSDYVKKHAGKISEIESKFDSELKEEEQEEKRLKEITKSMIDSTKELAGWGATAIAALDYLRNWAGSLVKKGDEVEEEIEEETGWSGERIDESGFEHDKEVEMDREAMKDFKGMFEEAEEMESDPEFDDV